jgi:hypothetical protein
MCLAACPADSTRHFRPTRHWSRPKSQDSKDRDRLLLLDRMDLAREVLQMLDSPALQMAEESDMPSGWVGDPYNRG